MYASRNENWNIGMRRVLKIIDEEKNRGYQAFYSGLYSTLPDVFVLDESNYQIIRVYEVTNYKDPMHYISPDKAKRYRDSLNMFPKAERILVVSFKENLRCVPDDYFIKYGIKVQELRYQD